MEDGAIDTLTTRFARDLAALRPEGRARLGLAVSGGPDSVALLLLMHEVAPHDFAVATVDHGLRPESAHEAGAVAALCAARAIPHTTLTLALAPGTGVQERARAARYAALGDWAGREGLAALVVAHHADDQAETLAMRLNRGAGVRGLAGMRPRTMTPGHPHLPLLRPLLGWRRAELADVIAQAGIEAADDPSNRDARFERVRVRQGLAASDWLKAERLAASAAHLAEADAALDWAAALALAQVRDEGDALLWRPDAPRAVALRVLESVVARLGRSVPRGRDVARWHDALQAGGIATLAGVRGDARGDAWRFSVAAAHRV
nr:tRNA lysidine(34) synthetase TilS [Novosphingobium percolationis]